MDGISLDTALLFKYFRGLTTGEERKRVEDWMQISEENEKTVLQAARIFYISQTSERILSRNSIEAYKKVQKRIDKRKKKIRLYEISIVAACFVGLLVISTAISFLLRKSSVLAPQQITVCANRGVRTSLDLPDGSIAYLNSGSTLSYPSSYDAEERKVTLVGEAYFSVKHDPAHPFIVSVSHDRLRVKVLGTEFNVRAYEKENVVQTTLVSGSVNIVMKEDKGKTNERNLYPSEKAVYDLTDKTLEVINVEIEIKSIDRKQHSEQEKEDEHLNMLSVPNGRRSSLILSDGTKVWINSGTVLQFPETFEKEKRVLYVNGEIYIEVAKHPQWPFYVKTNQMEVQVLGTSFGITAYDDEIFQTVVLKEGSVFVKNNQGNGQTIQPNQCLMVEKEEMTVKDVDVYDYISWIDGVLQFHEKSLQKVLNSLSRYYRVRFDCPMEIGQIKCSGNLVLFDDIDQVLQTLQRTLSISFSHRDEVIKIEYVHK